MSCAFSCGTTFAISARCARFVGGLTPRAAPQPSEVEQMAQVVRVMCEEEALDLANLPQGIKR